MPDPVSWKIAGWVAPAKSVVHETAITECEKPGGTVLSVLPYAWRAASRCTAGAQVCEPVLVPLPLRRPSGDQVRRGPDVDVLVLGRRQGLSRAERDRLRAHDRYGPPEVGHHIRSPWGPPPHKTLRVPVRPRRQPDPKGSVSRPGATARSRAGRVRA